MFKLTNHAKKRILERLPIDKSYNTVCSILKNELYLPIGYDLKKKNVKHCLFYIHKLNDYYIACLDERNNEIITLLFGIEFKN
jgi:hypothetical protein